MAYEIEFTAKIDVPDPEHYINECCWGGDVIRDRLLPAISAQYPDRFSEQEDWGWFIWIRRDRSLLAVDIYCDGPATGAFRVHISARKKKWFSFNTAIDAPEVELLKEIVVSELSKWASITAIRKFTPDFKDELST